MAKEAEVEKVEKENRDKAKAQKKKDKKFNKELLYRHLVGPNVLPIGPFTISLFVRGQLLEGKLRIAVVAASSTEKLELEGEKNALMGIIYPLAIRMYENGRPSTADILNFKQDAKVQLANRFDDRITDLYIESINQDSNKWPVFRSAWIEGDDFKKG